MMDLAAQSTGKRDKSSGWTVQDSAELYLIDRWGGGYYQADPEGYMTVAPLQDEGGTIRIQNVVEHAANQGLCPPLLVRFQDLVRHRVRVLNKAFAKAIEEYEYTNSYHTVYPIKVNQLREVVEEILGAGKPFQLGLEVGSKPELYAALAIHDDPRTLIVCNGYKDSQYIRTALLGTRLGKRIVLVAEKLSEVALTVQLSKEMNIKPLIGLRLRLTTEGTGNWARSGGDQAKFGLSTSEVLRAIQILREEGLVSSLRLLHFHIGSQIPNILTIKNAVREGARYYAKLRKMGCAVGYLDVGGGLAVDYDGSRSTFHSSMNYTVEEYARDVVYNVLDICRAENVEHPCLLSESGRALVAHHSVLVVSAFAAIRKPPQPTGSGLPDIQHQLVQDLLETERLLSPDGHLEAWHDLLQARQEAQKMFDVGLLGLETKASVDILFWRIAEKIRERLPVGETTDLPDELSNLHVQLADQHICNFSVFQSLLDHWALTQVFPVVPIHRLEQEPTVQSTLVDITCDSDGKVSRFINPTDTSPVLPLHAVDPGDPYHLGIFLTGAYQDIMGDNHNLFGRVSEVHVFLDEQEEEGFYIEEQIRGNTIGEILDLMQYDPKDLATRIKRQVDQAVRSRRIRSREGIQLLEEYRQGMNHNTYLLLD